MLKNPKRGLLGSLNVFYKPKTSKKCKGYPLIKFENFDKSRIVPKKPKGEPFGLTCTFVIIKKYGLVRNRTHALRVQKIGRS